MPDKRKPVPDAMQAELDAIADEAVAKAMAGGFTRRESIALVYEGITHILVRRMWAVATGKEKPFKLVK